MPVGKAALSEPRLAVRLESGISIGVPVMAPRANWKGFVRLSLVTCPVALYPATSESEKVSFNQLNRKTGHRIKYAKVDADTGEEVANDDIVKGYKVDTDTFIEVSKEELDNVALESTRTIEIDEFVDRSEIDPRYFHENERGLKEKRFCQKDYMWKVELSRTISILGVPSCRH
jgi:DNA end-binding protein Ku